MMSPPADTALASKETVRTSPFFGAGMSSLKFMGSKSPVAGRGTSSDLKPGTAVESTAESPPLGAHMAVKSLEPVARFVPPTLSPSTFASADCAVRAMASVVCFTSVFEA